MLVEGQARVRSTFAGFSQRCFGQARQRHSTTRHLWHDSFGCVEHLEPRIVLVSPHIDLAALTSIQGSIIHGIDKDDWSGSSISDAGDVNGDGFDDFLVGARRADDGAGKVYVVFGGPEGAGMIDFASLQASDQAITISPIHGGDHLGFSVSSAGDVNADGYDDLLIGGPGSSGRDNKEASAGESYLIFGGAKLPSEIDLNDPGTSMTIFFGSRLMGSGYSLSGAGDFNGDGYDDILIGAPVANTTLLEPRDPGQSYLIFGATEFPATIDLALLGERGTVVQGVDLEDSFGASVSGAGDVNNDGFDDLLIGAYRADGSNNERPWTGDTYVVFGNAFPPVSIDAADLEANGITIHGVNEQDQTGRSVSGAGDVNGDGFDDILISAWLADGVSDTAMNVGSSYVVFGGTDLGGTIELDSLGSLGIKLDGTEHSDVAGREVSNAGDVNGDGFDDLLIGVPGGDSKSNSRGEAGETYVVLGSASLPESIDLTKMNASVGFAIYGADRSDLSGHTVSNAGDVNGDGFDDLLVGAFDADGEENRTSGAGETYLIYGDDFSASVTHFGTAEDDILAGDAEANVIVGGTGDDELIGNGGEDVLRGGEGDDVLAVSDLKFRRIVGGNGDDTLRLDTSGVYLDLIETPDNRIFGIEAIDLTGSGANTLSVNVLEVLNISDESNTLIVRRDADDTVNFQDEWTRGENETVDDETFEVYSNGNAVLKLQTPVSTGLTIDLATLTADQGTVILGADEEDLCGVSVSIAGDINDDGYDDVLIGAYWGAGADNARPYSGESYLIFGHPSLPATIGVESLGSYGVKIYGANQSQLSGRSVSGAGDVNGDGIDDILIGVGDHSFDDAPGEAYLVLGSESISEIDHLDLAVAGEFVIHIVGADTDDNVGFSVSSAGDFNGDGYEDLLIGARNASAAENGSKKSGATYVVFGGPELPAEIQLGDLGDRGFAIYGREANDRSGSRVSQAGDVNGDGFDDLLIGAHQADGGRNSRVESGECYLVFGTSSQTENIDLSSDFHGVTIYGADEGDRIAFSISGAGDVDGDGFDDLTISAHRGDGPANKTPDSGEVYLIFGNPSLARSIDLADLDAAGIPLFGSGRERFGTSVTGAGDLNGDGFDDLAIGAPVYHSSEREFFGASYVFFGSPMIRQSANDVFPRPADIFVKGSRRWDSIGDSIHGGGDVNGDGIDDFVIGAPSASVGSGDSLMRPGASYIIFGGDFSSSVTHPGAPNGDELVGDANANVMIGGRGDDVLFGNGGEDVLRGGEGDDVLAVGDLRFNRIVGGNGTDTLRLDTSGADLDLIALADNRILGIEQIDLAGDGANALTLNVQEVLNISDESNTLVVRRDADDTVDTLYRGDDWVQGDDETIDEVVFEVFTSGAAVLKIQKQDHPGRSGTQY